jgi:hypothetical protein
MSILLDSTICGQFQLNKGLAFVTHQHSSPINRWRQYYLSVFLAKAYLFTGINEKVGNDKAPATW